MKKIFKIIYRNIPFKKQLYSVVKKVWSPPAGIFQHLYFTGPITVDTGNGKQFNMMHYGHSIENELFWRGLYNGWEKYSMRIWSHLSEKAEVIFDIGSNTGLYSLVSKTKNPVSEVHAFEPFQAIYTKLQKNIAMNGFEVKTNCIALSNYTGEGVIYTGDKNFAYSVTVNQNLWVKDKEPLKLDIKTITLKEYIEKNSIRKIDLMKIDVETHEPEVMQGFADYFLKFKPVLLIEVLNDEIAEKLNPYFNPSLFDFYNIDERTGIKKVSCLTKSDYYNFLVVPKEKAHLYNEKSIIHS